MDSHQRAVNVVNWIILHWVAVLIGLGVVIVFAFLVALVTELRKRYLTKKREEKIEGWVIQKTLALFALLFAGLDYFIPFMQQNLPILKNVKYVGGFAVALYSASNFLYAFKFKNWFKGFTTYLENRQKKITAMPASVPTVQPQQQPSQPVIEPDSPFEVQA